MDRHCKVLHIALSHGGGVEVYTRMLIRYTHKIFDTVLVCSSEYNKALLPESCKIYELDIPREIAPLKDLKAAFIIRKIIKKEKPDVVYCHSSMAGAVGRIAAMGLCRKVVYNPHGWSFDMEISSKKKAFYRMLEKSLAKITDKIITISEYEKNTALSNRICKEEKIQVILNGIDLEKCRKSNRSRDDFGYSEKDYIVGCCARISEQKDPLLFAEVAGRIVKKCSEARFVWVGDGEMKAEFVAALKKYNVYEKTLITGWVDNPCEYISLFDIAVLFSKWEGFGLCLAEYVAEGKPVVATNVGAIPEVLKDVEYAKVSDSRNADFLAELVLSYKELKNTEEIRGKCTLDSKKFDFRITAEKTVDVIENLL